MSLVLILALIVPSCTVKRDTTTTATTTDADRIAALESKVSQLQSKVASLPESTPQKDYSTDIEALYGEIDSLREEMNGVLDDVKVMLAAWEAEQNSSSSGSSEEEYVTTRWTPSISLTQAITDVNIDTATIGWYRTIKDEGTYTIVFDVKNDSGKDQNIALFIVFTPSSRDTSIDVRNTGLYSYMAPILYWDVSFKPTNGVNCSRMEFISDLFTISPTTTTPLKIYLDFDLYYAR